VSSHIFSPSSFAVILSLLGASAHGATHYVSTYDCDPVLCALKAQWAIDQAEKGDEVILGSGSYRGNLVLKHGVNLSGSQRGCVFVSGATPAKPVLTLAWDNTVKGLTIYGSPHDGCGIYAELGVPPAKTGSFTPFRISDCKIKSCAGAGILVKATQQPEYDWLPESAETEEDIWQAYLRTRYDTELQVQVSGCEVTECGGSGIVVCIEDLSGEQIRPFPVPGPGPWPPFDGPCEEWLFEPIKVGFQHPTLTVSNSTIANCGQDGATAEAGWYNRAKVVIGSCIVRNNGANGVCAYSRGATPNGAVAQINSSLISGNGKTGISAVSYDPPVWTGYWPFDAPYETGKVFATSSTIAGNSTGIRNWRSLKNCIVYANTVSDMAFGSPGGHSKPIGDYISHSCTSWGAISGAWGNIDSDPLFADPVNGDFRLLPGSPCIDAGGMYTEATIMLQDGVAAISWDPGKDLDGNPRISGNGPDMGAYEAAGDPPNYLLETSEDLISWTEGYYGPATTWTDSDGESPGTKFYRVRVGR